MSLPQLTRSLRVYADHASVYHKVTNCPSGVPVDEFSLLESGGTGSGTWTPPRWPGKALGDGLYELTYTALPDFSSLGDRFILKRKFKLEMSLEAPLEIDSTTLYTPPSVPTTVPLDDVYADIHIWFFEVKDTTITTPVHWIPSGTYPGLTGSLPWVTEMFNDITVSDASVAGSLDTKFTMNPAWRQKYKMISKKRFRLTRKKMVINHIFTMPTGRYLSLPKNGHEIVGRRYFMLIHTPGVINVPNYIAASGAKPCGIRCKVLDPSCEYLP